MNRRDHDRVVTSGFWRLQDTEAARQAVSRVEDIQDHLLSTRADRALETRYEVLTGDDRAASDDAMRSLAEFVVGSCDDELLARLRETLGTGHGPNPFGASRAGKGQPA